ncbi:MAG: thioredoxin domain-containing protein [Deltaproteobacteria bacterium]|jgi:protein-disulfide isomerase/uncharacterized membrane protein
MGKNDQTTNPSAAAIVALLAFALAASLLAVFQWMELLVTQQGGASFCGIDETLNCEAVWNSPFAKSIHGTTRLPLAGWGLVWGLSAFFVSAHLAYDAIGRRGYDARIFALRMVAGGGVAAVLVFVGVSFSLGQVCLTCVATYVLVGGFAVFAFRVKPLRPLRDVSPMSAALPVAASLCVAYAALLVPGTNTPVEAKMGLELPAKKAEAAKTPPPATPTSPTTAPPAAPTTEVGRYLMQVPPAAKQAISDSLYKMRTSKSPDLSKYGVRHRDGLANAPVKIVDFSDIRCGHCRNLAEVMEQLHEAAPPGSFSSESRWFPLDAGCNPSVPPELKDETGVRCLAPRVLVCLEDDDNFEKARVAMFKEQQSLTQERVWKIAEEATGKKQAALKACVGSKATTAKIAEDVEYANQFDVHGTPVVLINGRQATSVPPFLYALILAKGNIDDPGFKSLPPPRADAHVH